jgi:hypothetical protein
MASVKGGDQMAKRLAKIAAKVAKLPNVRVGFLENAKYPNGTPVAMIAAIQEYGAPRARIPPRPFFRTMITAHKGEWGKELGLVLKSVDYDAKIALDQMGQHIAGELRQSIVDTIAPALSPITLMLRMMRKKNPALVVTGRTVGEAARRVAAGEKAKGVSTKPLVDSGNLLNSIDHEVSDGTP